MKDLSGRLSRFIFNELNARRLPIENVTLDKRAILEDLDWLNNTGYLVHCLFSDKQSVLCTLYYSPEADGLDALQVSLQACVNEIEASYCKRVGRVANNKKPSMARLRGKSQWIKCKYCDNTLLKEKFTKTIDELICPLCDNGICANCAACFQEVQRDINGNFYCGKCFNALAEARNEAAKLERERAQKARQSDQLMVEGESRIYSGNGEPQELAPGQLWYNTSDGTIWVGSDDGAIKVEAGSQAPAPPSEPPKNELPKPRRKLDLDL